MRLKCIACEVLARPLYFSAATSPHIIDIQLIEKGLHEHPQKLRDHLQDQIDATRSDTYEAILLAYGLCGQATSGLTARDVPMVIPRAHDCITLFLGSRTRYQDQFSQYPGTYWYVQDYIEREKEPGSSLSLGAAYTDDIKSVYNDYVAKFGQENADYLMEVMGAWHSHYQRAAYIDMGIGNGDGVQAKAEAEAQRRGWTFERMVGDMVLIRRLLVGPWEDDFLTVQPGQQIHMSYDENILCANQIPT